LTKKEDPVHRSALTAIHEELSVNDPLKRDEKPFPGQTFLVECDGVRHLATKDQSGNWRTISRQKKMLGTVEVIRALQ
jgi:hypothetical protein